MDLVAAHPAMDARSGTSSSSSSGSAKDNTPTTPVPCLRRGDSAKSSGGHSRPDHVRFDEEIIAEHDKLRGTRQKIDEPNTPYHQHNVEAVDDDDNASASGAAPSSVSASPRVSTSTKVRKSSVDFTKSSPQKSHALQWGDLESRLKVAKDEVEGGEGVGGHTPSDDTDDEAPHKREFEEHRKKHYNEFQRVKEWRAKQAAGLDDDDDEE
jgi:protein phosphatase inhibitor 2